MPVPVARPLLEACCDSVVTARLAELNGAGRIELCGPGPGGTTPSLGLVEEARSVLTARLHVMIRPHTRDFVYDTDDLAVMHRDIAAMQRVGVDGVVFGPLSADGTLNREQTSALMDAAGSLAVTFHRAFDLVPDQQAALDTLMQIGVRYILTSGSAPTALAGAEQLRALQQAAGQTLTILAGGSIRADTIGALLAIAPLREVHARGTDPAIIRDLARVLHDLPDALPDALSGALPDALYSSPLS